MPRDPQPQAERGQGSGWGTGPGPCSRKAGQTDVQRDRAAALSSFDAVDGSQTQQCGGTETAGGVSQLPLVVSAGYGEESDGHGVQVKLAVCEDFWSEHVGRLLVTFTRWSRDLFD